MNKMFSNPDAARKEHEKRHLRSRKRIRIEPADPVLESTRKQPNGNPEIQPADILEAAGFIVLLAQPLSWLKLQDLLYYAQGWHLAWDDQPLFSDAIFAAADGVRIPVIQKRLANSFSLTPADLPVSNPIALSESQQQTLSGIVQFYAAQSHFKLAGSIMQEEPWLAARARARKNSELIEISSSELRSYFESLE